MKLLIQPYLMRFCILFNFFYNNQSNTSAIKGEIYLFHKNLWSGNLLKFLFALTGIVSGMNLWSQEKLWLVDPLQPVFPDSNTLNLYSNKYQLDFPAGTVAEVNVLLNLPARQKFTVAASMNGKILPLECWSLMVDVPVEQNTGPESRTEAFSNRINPYVIRRAPFRIYEAIVPLKANIIPSVNSFTNLRLSIPPSLLPDRGNYKIHITAAGQGWKRTGVFVVKIHPYKLPALKDGNFFYTNWFSLVQIETKHQVTRWTQPWYDVMDKYAQLMAHGRQNCILIPSELIAMEDGRITLNEDKMIRFIDVFRKYGFKYFESPHIMYRGDDDNWGDPELKVVLTKNRYYTPAGKKDVDTIISLIKNFTIKYGIADAWMQHISDEPTGVQAKCYRDIVSQVKNIYPNIKIMEATNDRDSLVGAIDLWCPIIDDFQKNEAFFRAREAVNEKVLVYTCLIPGGQWLNRLLDQERLRQVYFGWGAARYNTFGYLHWGLNQYVADPWQQSVVHHPAPGAGANNFLPAGDTHCIYPGEDGPLSSTRFEAHRTGVEDYEMLQLLKQKDSPLAQSLLAKVFRTYTDYSTSIKEYRTVRKKLLQAL